MLNLKRYSCATCGGEGRILDPSHPQHPSQTGDGEGEDWCLDCADSDDDDDTVSISTETERR